MIGKAAARTRPTALGSMLQAATYGMTTPRIFGCTKSPLLAIWAANLRQGGSGKKAKKKGVTTYVEAIDFLIGSNPIQGLLQFWGNNNARYPLDFTVQRSSLANSVVITDPDFYFVIGVTAEIALSGTFNDYGGQGAVAYGPTTTEYPLWNKALAGPDIDESSGARWNPWTFKWVIGDGTTVFFPDAAQMSGNGFVDIYYAKLSALNKKVVPATSFRLVFESSIANNNAAYAGFTSQQVIMPEFAGASSPNFDLGATGMIQDTRPEVMGSYSIYKRGDADFFDMIEGILNSGMMQVGTGLGKIHAGVNLNTLPGTVQRDFFQKLSLDLPHATFWQPNAIGSRLVAFSRSRPGAGSPAIADTDVNTWNNVFTNTQKAAWYSNGALGGATPNIVTSTPAGGTNFNNEIFIAELDPSMDTFDLSATNSGSGGNATCSITTTGTPGLIVACVFCDDAVFGAVPFRWSDMFPSSIHSWDVPMIRRVSAPGTYSLSISVGSGTNWWVVMMAFKQSQAPSYPKALGNILDRATALNARLGCRAGGLFGSLSMSSQKKALDWLDEIYRCANTSPYWSGHVLKSVFRSEVSAIGNGVLYTAPTAAGPVLNITESMLIGDDKGQLVTLGDKTPSIDEANVLQIQFIDRQSDYNPSVASWPESSTVAQYGPKKGGASDDGSTGSPLLLEEIHDPLIARKLLAIQARRNAMIVGLSYKFKGSARLSLLEPMDLVTLPLTAIIPNASPLSTFPVRLISIAEDSGHNFDCEAEPFFYGVHAPDTALVATNTVPYQPNSNVTPASVNTPIIFEEVPRLGSALQIVVSDSDPNYGGCAVFLSTDGGTSYNPLKGLSGSNVINGNGITGFSTADWPIATDPDTTNDLPVDLTESLGSLLSYLVADEDNFVYPCYIAGGTAAIPYGLMTYAVATLTATNKYTLKATGGGGNHLRRCVFGAPQLLTDVDHPNASRWAFLNPSGQGIFRVALDPKWIGQTLHFKFLAFNTFQGGQQQLAAATDYTFTPTGKPGALTGGANNSYTLTGGALTNPTTTSIAMAQATATLLSGLKLNYNARTFTISAPSVPTTYYVTIADPGLTGDAGTALSLTATCQTSNALVGVAGNIYIGSILALPAGGGTSTTPGGSPVAGSNLEPIVSFYSGKPPASQVLVAYKVERPVTLPANLASPNSLGRLGVNPAATAVYTIFQNGVSAATISISTGGAFTFATTGGAAITFAAGDEFKLVAPTVQDTALTDVGLTIVMTR